MQTATPSTLFSGARDRLLREPRRPATIRNSSRAHWYVVGAVCVGAFMGQLDASIVTVALPHIGSALDASESVAQWVALSYMLVLLVALAIAGAISDRLGRKLLYTWGFAVFTLGSLLCGLAPSLPTLIAARVLQGLGAAMLQANSVALIREAMPDDQLTRGIGIQGAAQAIGLALGPAVGGMLIALGGWRLIFFVNVPVGVVAIVLARLLVPRSGRLALGGGVVPVEPGERAVEAQGRASGGRGWIAALRALGSLLARPAISLGLASGLISYLTMFGALFAIPYYLVAAGVGPTSSGLQLALLPIALGIVAPLAGRASTEDSRRRLGAAGLLALAVALEALALAPDGGWRMLSLLLAGAGLGLFIPANNAAVMAAGPRARAGTLGGVVNMTRTLGAIVGVALASALYAHVGGAGVGASESAAAHGLLVTLATLGGLAAIGAALQSVRR